MAINANKDMNINEYLGLNFFEIDGTGRWWEHEEIFTAIVNAIGFEAVRSCLPFSKEELAVAIQCDKHLNQALPRSFDWNAAAGFKVITNSSQRYIYIGSKLTNLCNAIGINKISPADGICILKQCARMLVSDTSSEEHSHKETPRMSEGIVTERIDKEKLMEAISAISKDDEVQVIEILLTSEGYDCNYATVLFPYDQAEIDISFSGDTFEEMIEELVDEINRHISEMIDHLDDCKLRLNPEHTE